MRHTPKQIIDNALEMQWGKWTKGQGEWKHRSLSVCWSERSLETTETTEKKRGVAAVQQTDISRHTRTKRSVFKGSFVPVKGPKVLTRPDRRLLLMHGIQKNTHWHKYYTNIYITWAAESTSAHHFEDETAQLSGQFFLFFSRNVFHSVMGEQKNWCL